jgi:hypothetical protein
VLTSFPGRFSTLHPSCQYSSICASVSADPPSELAVCIACRRDPPHRRFESRVLEVEVNPKLRAQVGMPIRDHVDPFDRPISSTFSRPPSDSIEGHIMMFPLAHGAYSVAWRAP